MSTYDKICTRPFFETPKQSRNRKIACVIPQSSDCGSVNEICEQKVHSIRGQYNAKEGAKPVNFLSISAFFCANVRLFHQVDRICSFFRQNIDRFLTGFQRVVPFCEYCQSLAFQGLAARKSRYRQKMDKRKYYY